MSTYTIKKHDVTYLNELLLINNELQVLPYEVLKEFPLEHIQLFCLENGIYSLPTTELMEFLRSEIGDRHTIEVAAGNGVYSRELNIIGTDSFMQAEPEIEMIYTLSGQPTVNYGAHVEKLDAIQAVKKYKPDIVIASWMTHKYNPKEHFRGGNAFGVNEKLLFERVNKYIHIGNDAIHKHKPLLAKKHRTIYEPWILSRSKDKMHNCIYIWGE